MSAIRVELELDDGSFTTRMIHAGETIRQFDRSIGRTYVSINRMSDASKGFLATLRDVSVVTGAFAMVANRVQNVMSGWSGDIVRVNAEIERLQILLKGMSQAADPVKEASDQIKFLRDFALEAPFSLQSLADTFVKLRAGGIDPMKGAIKGLVDGIAAFGGAEDSLKRATIALFQMGGKGVIQMEELRQQLGEAIPRATELMARSMGVSMAELIKKIATGTVQSKPALAALQLELSRTFGGSALRMMETFNGLVSRSRTLLQTFALDIGSAGFSDAVKKQIQDFNRLLSGSVARGTADVLGRSLTRVVEILRSILDGMIEWRREIMDVGQALVHIIGLAVGLRALRSIAAVIGTNFTLLRAQVTATSAQLVVFRNALASVNLFAAATGATRFAVALGAIRVALPLVGSGLLLVLGWLPLVGGAIYLVASYFGLFSNRAKQAWEELETFGAVSRRMVDEGSRYVAQEQRKLDEMIRRRDEAMRRIAERQRFMNPNGNIGPDLARAEKMLNDQLGVNEQMVKVAGLEAKLREHRQELVEKSASEETETFIEEMNKRQAVLQSEYDKRGRDLQEQHQRDRLEYLKAGRDTIDLDSALNRNLRSNAENLHRSRIELMQEFYERARQLVDRADEEDQRAGTLVMQRLDGMINQELEMLRQTQEQISGVPSLEKGFDQEKILKKARQQLEDIHGEIEGLTLGLSGASTETAKLVHRLQDGLAKNKFGEEAAIEVRKLIDALVDAEREQEALQDAMDGRSKFERDLQNMKIKVEQDLFEAQTRNMNEFDKFMTAVQMGKYAGVGPGTGPKSAAQAAVDGVRDSLSRANEEAASVAETIQEKTFGQETKSSGEALIELIGDINYAWSGFRANVEGTPIANVFERGINASRRTNFTPRGAISVPGAGFVEKVISKESSNDANASNDKSSAKGLGQFIESTWLAFLRDMHPEMLAAGRKAALEFRTNPALMTEAIAWYAKQNAETLGKHGIETDDANLYLAHFLGPQGVITTFAHSAETMLKDIPDLAKAITANPMLKGMSVGDLKEWAKSFMGTESTVDSDYVARYRNDPSLPIPDYIDPKLAQELEDVRVGMQRLNQITADNDLADKMKDIRLAISEASEVQDEFNKRTAATKRLIADGEFGPDKNPESDRYKDLIALAQRWDEVERQLADRKKARSAADSAQDRYARERIDLMERERGAFLKLQDPAGLGNSSAYFRMLDQMTAMTKAVGDFYGRDSAEFKAALADKQAAMRQFRNTEILEEASSLRERSLEWRRELMTESQARQSEMELEIARMQRLLREFTGTAEQRKLVEETVQEAIAAARMKAASAGPLMSQMRAWSDFYGNMETALTGWLDTATDKLAEFAATGKADFGDMIDSFVKDTYRIAIRWALSGIGGSFGQKAGIGGAQGGTAKALGNAAATGSKALGAGIAHTGAIIGATRTAMRIVPGSMFDDVRRFHGGGIVGDEVPIIAKKKEGVFTPEQMKAIGPRLSQQINLSANVTVNGSGGTQGENKDLADRTGAAVREQLRSLVNEELRTQMQPGGVLNR